MAAGAAEATAAAVVAASHSAAAATQRAGDIRTAEAPISPAAHITAAAMPAVTLPGDITEAMRATEQVLPAMATRPAAVGAAVAGAVAVGAEPAGAAAIGMAASGPERTTVQVLPVSCRSCRWRMPPIGTAAFRTTTPMTSITPGTRPTTVMSRPTRRPLGIRAALLTRPDPGPLPAAMRAHRIPRLVPDP